jgi:hypothetical protein
MEIFLSSIFSLGGSTGIVLLVGVETLTTSFFFIFNLMDLFSVALDGVRDKLNTQFNLFDASYDAHCAFSYRSCLHLLARAGRSRPSFIPERKCSHYPNHAPSVLVRIAVARSPRRIAPSKTRPFIRWICVIPTSRRRRRRRGHHQPRALPASSSRTKPAPRLPCPR